MLDLLLLALIITYCIDVSGFWNEISGIISGWLTDGKIKKSFTLKPFSCPLCMTFWCGLAYLLITGTFTIPMVAYVCLLSYLTTVFADIMRWVVEALKTLIIKLNDKL